MRDRFVSLAALLRPPAPRAPNGDADAERVEAIAPEPILAECALFRARLRELFDRERAALLADVAAEVVARELRTAPADIDAIVSRLIERYAEEIPVTLRVSPADRDRVAVDLPLEVDPGLRGGDAVLVVRDGAMESRLATRLDAVVRAAQRR